MTKRIRRCTRYIWVDTMETAKDIEHYCIQNNLVEGLSGEAYTTCRAMDFRTTVDYARYGVVFLCTADQWHQIANVYNLIRMNRYKYTYHYKLK